MARRRLKVGNQLKLSVTIESDVRFSDIDVLHMIWHGHYIQYLEMAREAFGKKYGLSYQDMAKAEIVTPIVEMQLFYHSPGRLGDRLEITVHLIIQPAAKLEFYYEIKRANTDTLLVEARTVQAFTSTAGEMIITMPPLLSALVDRVGKA